MKLLTRNQNPLIYVTLFFVGFFFYFIFVVNPSLYLIKNYREFFTDIYFFKKYFNFPGNPTEYLSRLLIQFYNLPVIASMIVTTILYSIYWLGFFSFGKAKNGMVAAFVPVIILIAMHNDYNHSLKFDIEILITLTISLIYFRFIKDKSVYKFLLYPALLCFLYFVAGIKTVYLFSLLAILSELFTKGKRLYSLAILLETVAVILLFNHIFFISYNDVFKAFKEIQNTYALWFLPFLLYLSIVLVFIFYALSNLKRLTIIRPRNNTDAKKSFINFKNLLVLLVITLLTVGLYYFSFDKDQKVKLSVHHFGRNKDWKKVIELANQTDSLERSEIIYTNMALYFTGRIYDDLFKFNQDLGSNGLIGTKLTSFDELVPNQEIYLELGALSYSIVWGTEATNVYGANPYVLKNLIKAYLSIGCIKEAQKMLNLLDHSLFNKKWVRQYQKFINDTSLINSDPELSHFRKIQVPDAIISKTAMAFNMYLLTGQSNSNKMAYDYLMISALLDNNMKDFETGLTGLKFFGYSHFPKLIFEGFIIYSLGSEECPINIEEYTYDQSIIERFKAFQVDYRHFKDDPEAVRKNMFPKYGDTYWYYLKFPRPVVNNKNNKVKEKERE